MPSPTSPAATGDGGGPDPGPDLRIGCILFDGEVARSEADEYVQTTNHGAGSQDLEDWVLRDKNEPSQSFTFPSYALEPGATVRVYTDQEHREWGGFSFNRGSSIWNNRSADIAQLLDGEGNLVSELTYDVGSPPGCES